MKNAKSLSPPLLYLYIQKQHVIYSGSRRRGQTSRAALSRRAGAGGISMKIKKSACVLSVKCFTVLYIRPPEVFCDIYNAPNSILAGAPPKTHTGEFPTLRSQLGPPWQGAAARRTFAPGATDLLAATGDIVKKCHA